MNGGTINATTEDYLRALFRIETFAGRVSTTDLAREAGVSAPAASEMLAKMADAGLVEHVKYKGATLSEAGRRHAILVTRRHRLWEVFLIEHLGFAWDEVHEHAHHLERIGSSALVDRLDAFLGHPTHDPHGDPIPGPDGSFPETSLLRLADLPVGTRGIVRRVSDASPEILRYASSLGLLIGEELRVLEHVSFDNGLRIQLGDNAIIVSEKLAAQISMELLEPSPEGG